MTTDRPNVLLITVDQWPGALLGCAGHAAIRTPTLDQLAANGAYFPNAYSDCPVCAPARRTLMTGLRPHSHGVLDNTGDPMPDVPTLAQAFRNAGYQAMAVGKLHVNPQRNRIGFDDVLLDEEGRGGEGVGADDYDLFLGDQGFPGQRFAGGMNNNEYIWRPWHLEERLHVTNWAAQQMSRQIIRRDPARPAFWYLSFSHPHPPLTPLQAYWEMYRDEEIPEPYVGDWMDGVDDHMEPAVFRLVQSMRNRRRNVKLSEILNIRRAFYALCTHIDHQLRVVLGTLREQGILQDTIICFTADHGEMLGNHRLWAKCTMYEDSVGIPMILTGTEAQRKANVVGHHQVDKRLVSLCDVMPTLLDLAGIEPPPHCEGLRMVGKEQRDHLFACYGKPGAGAQRMLRDERYKLIYYPEGNHRQLFDLQKDPLELHDLAKTSSHREPLDNLSRSLMATLPEEERNAWSREGELIGFSSGPRVGRQPNVGFSGQRGLQWPNP